MCGTNSDNPYLLKESLDVSHIFVFSEHSKIGPFILLLYLNPGGRDALSCCSFITEGSPSYQGSLFRKGNASFCFFLWSPLPMTFHGCFPSCASFLGWCAWIICFRGGSGKAAVSYFKYRMLVCYHSLLSWLQSFVCCESVFSLLMYNKDFSIHLSVGNKGILNNECRHT